MIVSQGRGYVFVHIPKTGGTALTMALEARAKRDDIFIADTPKARRRRHRLDGVKTRGRLWKHATMADIDGLLPAIELEQLFAFTLVRNPWDRLVSYYHWLRVQTFVHPAVEIAKRHDFPRFVLAPEIRSSLRNGPARSYMTRADGVEQCAAFIRLEHFAEDAQPLFRHLGFALTLGRENASDRLPDFRGYYTDALAETVGEDCAEDVARFGYRFSS